MSPTPLPPPPSSDPLDALVAALRAPLPADPAATRQIMDAVRQAARHAPPALEPARRVAVRALREPVAPLVSSSGFAAAAGVVALLALGAIRSSDAPAGALATRIAIGDTVASALRDTLRLVRFVLHAPFASTVTIAGDFNAWSSHGTPLHRDVSSDLWSVALALAPGQHRYSFVVNDTQWVRDPAARAAPPHELAPPQSIMTVR